MPGTIYALCSDHTVDPDDPGCIKWKRTADRTWRQRVAAIYADSTRWAPGKVTRYCLTDGTVFTREEDLRCPECGGLTDTWPSARQEMEE